MKYFEMYGYDLLKVCGYNALKSAYGDIFVKWFNYYYSTRKGA